MPSKSNWLCPKHGEIGDNKIIDILEDNNPVCSLCFEEVDYIGPSQSDGEHEDT